MSYVDGFVLPVPKANLAACDAEVRAAFSHEAHSLPLALSDTEPRTRPPETLRPTGVAWQSKTMP